MPKQEQITISLIDLHNVVSEIRDRNYTGQAVSLIDLDNMIVIRDTNGMHIGIVNKTITE